MLQAVRASGMAAGGRARAAEIRASRLEQAVSLLAPQPPFIWMNPLCSARLGAFETSISASTSGNLLFEIHTRCQWYNI